ncbi:VWA-like domain containing protein [uncultured Caudovirales phage]|uniref:VWA-like domain containing protein n=1 Tax=uncultured Caudovirales phage TaxID=2100421 RepID=A0A6J5KJW4_9CAUD|nr:VWA-like domain containing protein [uncultured Caudovirales phage]
MTQTTIPNQWDRTIHSKLSSVVRKMLRFEPFYGHLATAMLWKQDSTLEQMFSTDGTVVSYNPAMVDQYIPDWWVSFNRGAGLTKTAWEGEKFISPPHQPEPTMIVEDGSKVVRALLCAALTKVALRHPWRAETKGMQDKGRMMRASEAAIRSIVRSSMCSDEFPGATTRDLYRASDELGFEQLYDLDNPTPPEEEGGGGQGAGVAQPGEVDQEGARSFGGFPSDDPTSDSSEAEAEAQSKVGQAMRKAKEAGNMPGDLAREINKVNDSGKDWRNDLRKFLGGGSIPEQSWSRPNRRYIADDIYLPGNPKEGPGEIAVFVDTSGSVNEKLLAKFIAELGKINADLQPEKTHVAAIDTRIQWTEEFTAYEDVTCKPAGRGGTDFAPAFKWIEEKGVNIKAAIYFTDLECSSFGPKPDYPVLWIVWPGGSTRKPPFGDVIYMES